VRNDGVLDVSAEDEAIAPGELLGTSSGGDLDFTLKDLDGNWASGFVLLEGATVFEANDGDAQGAFLDESAGGVRRASEASFLEDGV
jgi:hypothetical protein